MKIIYKIGMVLILITALTLFSLPTQASAALPSLKDVYMTVKTVITSVYDGLGRLIGHGQTVNSQGVDLQGNNFKSASTIDFEIKLGKAVIGHRTTITESWHEDGSWLKTTQEMWYKSDANGCIEGAWGKETIEGRENDYYISQDEFTKLGGNLGSDVVVNGTPVDKDLDNDGVIEDNEKNLIKVRGNKYSGTADLQFIIIDGEAYISHREQKLGFYSSITGQKQFDRKVVSDYEYDIKGGKVVMTDDRSTTTDTYPQVFAYTDENGVVHQTDTHLFQARYIHTKYEYDEGGNLMKASGKGYGWGLVETQIGFAVYTSDIEVTYQIINGQVCQTIYEETAYYSPAQNPPDAIPPAPVRSGDPTGTIIGMFNIHTDHVAAGNQNAGAYNEYTWLVVRVDLDDSGNPERPDGNPDNDKVYLVRALTRAGASNWDQKTFNISNYKVGDRITFLGDTTNINTRDINGNPTTHRILRLTTIQ